MSDYICPKCGSKQALADVYIGGSEWASEPYENGKEEPVKYKNGRINEFPNIFLNICMAICPDCDYCEWLSIEESDYEIHNIYNHTIPEPWPWIKMKEKPPENKRKYYLCYNENNGMRFVLEWNFDRSLNKSINKWRWYYGPYPTFIVTHYQELPPSP